MKKKKKPFYKRWWVIAIAAFLAFGFITGLTQGGGQEDVEQQEVEVNEQESNDEEKGQVEKEEVKKEENDEPEIIKLDDFSMAEFSVEDMEARIENKKIYLSFRWINQSGEDAPFTALGFLDVHQGDEVLDEVSGSYEADNKTGILFKNANGGGHSVDLEYELKNEDDIKLVFGSTLEEITTKEEQTVEF